MLGEDEEFVAIEFGNDAGDLRVVEMLENLAEKDDVGGGEIVVDDVEAAEVNVGGGEFFLVVGDESGNDVAGDVAGAEGAELPADMEIAAAGSTTEGGAGSERRNSVTAAM